jgi:hypothetical protein
VLPCALHDDPAGSWKAPQREGSSEEEACRLAREDRDWRSSERTGEEKRYEVVSSSRLLVSL